MLEVFLALFYLADIFLNGKAYQLFDMDKLITIPSLFQALKLYIIGLISLSFLIVESPDYQRLSKLFLFTFASLFIYASVDKILEIHKQIPKLLHTPYNYEWMLIYISIGLITILEFYQDFIALWDFHRRSLLIMAAGRVLIVIGGLGTEIFKYELLQPLLGQIFQQGELVAILVEKLRVAVEEFLEMLGESITIYGICLYVTKRLEEEPSSAICASQQRFAIAQSPLPEAIAQTSVPEAIAPSPLPKAIARRAPLEESAIVLSRTKRASRYEERSGWRNSSRSARRRDRQKLISDNRTLAGAWIRPPYNYC